MRTQSSIITFSSNASNLVCSNRLVVSVIIQQDSMKVFIEYTYENIMRVLISEQDR